MEGIGINASTPFVTHTLTPEQTKAYEPILAEANRFRESIVRACGNSPLLPGLAWELRQFCLQVEYVIGATGTGATQTGRAGGH
jgi:hypothetical protein